MLRFWRNPEFVRHRRAELRRNRALAVMLVVLVVCTLIGLSCWASHASEMEALRQGRLEFNNPQWLVELEQNYARDIWRVFYRWIILLQAGVLCFWSLLSCAQSVSGERERKTWDFQRTTRLSPGELLIGKLFGEPVLAYFIGICCLPVALVAAVMGGIPLADFVSAYILIFAGALFIGRVGLWLSSLLETRSRGFGLIGALAFFVLFALAYNFRTTNFPGLAGFSPLAGLLSLLELDEGSFRASMATIFGQKVPWLLDSLLLYVTFGAWLLVMLLRNLKRDYEGMRLLTRWQALGCAAFLNFVVYAFFHLHEWQNMGSHEFATMVVGLNAIVLFTIGLATLIPYERLKVWNRRRAVGEATLFAEEGLSWPWLAISAVIAYGLLVWGLFAWRNVLGFELNILAGSALQLLTVLLFVTADVLFIQWCRLTRMRAPLLKGVLYLGLYYAAATVLTVLTGLQSQSSADAISGLLTPAAAFDNRITTFHVPLSVMVGWVIQCGVIGLLITAITRRVQRPALAPAAAGD